MKSLNFEIFSQNFSQIFAFKNLMLAFKEIVHLVSDTLTTYSSCVPPIINYTIY